MSNQNSLSTAARLRAKLPYPLHPLVDLAFNLWWSWSFERLSIFSSIESQAWEQYHHNPVKFLDTVSNERLTQLATDLYYCKRVEVIAAEFEQYIQQTDTWAKQVAPQITFEQPMAYFSIEFGFAQYLPTYSGGLGVLAADHLKSASDLGLPVVGVSLLYQQGYFCQRLKAEGWQEENYLNYQFEELPLELCFDEQGEALTIAIQICDRSIQAQRTGGINCSVLDDWWCEAYQKKLDG